MWCVGIEIGSKHTHDVEPQHLAEKEKRQRQQQRRAHVSDQIGGTLGYGVATPTLGGSVVMGYYWAVINLIGPEP
jgi:hypothetical protein